jgi:hypothetical protein
MTAAGFTLAGAGHPIIPVMIGDAGAGRKMADRPCSTGHLRHRLLLPGGPEGSARIRTQMSAAHTAEDLDRAVEAFVEVGRETGGSGMRALVKAKPEPGLWMEDVPDPRDRAGRGPDPRPQDVDLRNRPPHHSWDELGAGHIPVPMVVGPRVHRGEIAEPGAGRGRPPRGSGSRGRGTSPAGTAATAGPVDASSATTTAQRRGQPAGAFAEYLVICPPRTCSRCPTTSPTTWRRCSTRWATPPTPPSTFDVVGEDVLITGAGPIGVMAAAIVRHIGARFVVITDVNEYRLDLAVSSGRRPRVDVRSETPWRRSWPNWGWSRDSMSGWRCRAPSRPSTRCSTS